MERSTLSLLATLLAASVGAGAAPAPLAAQGFGNRLKRAAAEAAKRRVEERVETRAGDATGAALDSAEQRARGGARPPAAPVTKTQPAAPAPATAARDTPPAAPPAPPRVNSGRDFTPGTRVLLATDFARDEIGDFPRAFRLRGGNAEVADVDGTRWLRATGFGEFEIPLPETLPERFTIEFDFGGPAGWTQYLYLVPHDPNVDPYHVHLSAQDGGVGGPGGYEVSTPSIGTQEGTPFRVQVMGDGEYVKVYMNGTRVANAPNAPLGRSRVLRMKVSASPEAPVLVGNVRIAAGGRDLYAALESSGRVTADGVLFDTNSDRLRPESAPVLKEIGDMLAAHPALRLSIEGHTDDVGGAAANQALSAKRAAAVRHHLVATLGVDAARLESVGFGATRPVAPNDSEANRQRNRRVELVTR